MLAQAAASGGLVFINRYCIVVSILKPSWLQQSPRSLLFSRCSEDLGNEPRRRSAHTIKSWGPWGVVSPPSIGSEVADDCESGRIIIGCRE
jgi:hypothetical protein